MLLNIYLPVWCIWSRCPFQLLTHQRRRLLGYEPAQLSLLQTYTVQHKTVTIANIHGATEISHTHTHVHMLHCTFRMLINISHKKILSIKLQLQYFCKLGHRYIHWLMIYIWHDTKQLILETLNPANLEETKPNTTHTHTFNGLFSRTTWVSRHQKGKPFWILLKQEIMGWQWHQLDHMQMICTALQTDNHPSLNFSRAGCSSWCPTNSVKALKVENPTQQKQ